MAGFLQLCFGGSRIDQMAVTVDRSSEAIMSVVKVGYGRSSEFDS